MIDDTELGRLITTARLGFKVVPVAMTHEKFGAGLMYMDGGGLRFEVIPGVPVLKLTWEELDKGPRRA